MRAHKISLVPDHWYTHPRRVPTSTCTIHRYSVHVRMYKYKHIKRLKNKKDNNIAGNIGKELKFPN